MAKAAKELPKRSEIPEESTWRLEDIFATNEEWQTEFKKLQADIPEIEKYQGKLSDSADILYDLLQMQDE